MNETEENAKFAIVYLAYGLESTKYQAILSIYTLCHHVKADIARFRIVIYTDAERSLFDKHLSGLPVQLEVLTKQQVKEFRGPEDYVFRIKPLILKDYFSKYNYNVLYCDTDTFYLRNPIKLLESIGPGHSIMNMEEYDFVDAGAVEPVHWFTLRQALKRYNYQVDGEALSIPISTMMWNAGIMGISRANSRLIDIVIKLNDDMYKNCHTFIVEQFVASYVLQKFTKLSSTEDYIEHYWVKGLKNVFSAEIPLFLKQQAGTSGQKLYDAALTFALETREKPHQNAEPLMERITKRVRLILKVARQGYI